MSRDYQKAQPAEFQRIPHHTRNEDWIKEFLHRGIIAHIGHASADQPFVTPTNYWYDEQNHRIIFHSNIAGRTRSNLETNPKVCLEVSEFGRMLPANTALEFGIQYRSVMLFGNVSIIDDEAEKTECLYGLLKKYFPQMTPGKEYRPITVQELIRTTVYTIQIESWTGKENWDDTAEESPDWPPLSEEQKYS